MKYVLTLITVIAVAAVITAFKLPSTNSIHSFKIKSIDGKEIDFQSTKAKNISGKYCF